MTLGCAHLGLNYLYFAYEKKSENGILKRYGIGKEDIINYKGKTL